MTPPVLIVLNYNFTAKNFKHILYQQTRTKGRVSLAAARNANL